MPKPGASRVKAIAITLGSVLSLLGTVGSAFSVAPLHEQAKDLRDRHDAMAKEVQQLTAAESLYFLANQQGDLIFVLAAQGNARNELAASIYAGNLLDRATPIRNMIGALAMAHALDYRRTYDAYEKLNDEARKALDWERFDAVKRYERDVVIKAQGLIAAKALASLKLQAEANAVENTARIRGTLAIALSVLGTSVLLLANLLSELAGNDTKAKA